MQWTSILAIYALFWVLCAFVMLPLGIRTPADEGTQVEAGHADSAPVNFQPGKVAIRATILSAVLCALFVANYSFGWITAEDIMLF